MMMMMIMMMTIVMMTMRCLCEDGDDDVKKMMMMMMMMIIIAMCNHTCLVFPGCQIRDLRDEGFQLGQVLRGCGQRGSQEGQGGELAEGSKHTGGTCQQTQHTYQPLLHL